MEFHKAPGIRNILLHNIHVNIKNKALIYTSILKSILLYAFPIWGLASPTSLNICKLFK